MDQIKKIKWMHNDESSHIHAKESFEEQLPDLKFKNIIYLSETDTNETLAVFKYKNSDKLIAIDDNGDWFIVDIVILTKYKKIIHAVQFSESAVEMFENVDDSVQYTLFPFHDNIVIEPPQLNEAYAEKQEIKWKTHKFDYLNLFDKQIHKKITNYINNAEFIDINEGKLFELPNDHKVYIGCNMIIVMKNNKIISGFFDTEGHFQSGDCIDIAYVASNGDFIYCAYGDCTSIVTIQFDNSK